MPTVAIGVVVYEQPGELSATLDALRSYTPEPFDLVLLADGPDAAVDHTLKALGLAVSSTTRPQGMPACFNRLTASRQADLYVLLESGTRVSPGWLRWILAALGADPRHGLAGPSTNSAWNEQCVMPESSGSPMDLARCARETEHRFRGASRTLEPLHSLADFCYAVRREVVQAVGSADESYGLGPCWEMDYNIRAARCGYRGVWACSAFAWRAPFTQRRRQMEAQLFEASRRHYQDKFCGRRLRGEQFPYEPHCKGDECEHFAPGELIQPPAVTSSATPKLPLVSCIMPTRGRRREVLQSIRYFQRQTYAERELIILDDDSEDDLAPFLPCDPAIRYYRLPRRQSIGAKRNRGCELAEGTIIAQWDDDDWYGPQRLALQVEPILAGHADITGLTALFLDLPQRRFWICTPDLHRRMFVGDVHGGTLVYRRSLWRKPLCYPDSSLAEDAAFLHQTLLSGARLSKLENQSQFIYVRHGANSWQIRCGDYLDPQGWKSIPEPAFWQPDRSFYFPPVQSPPTGPLVTCVMPTADRRRFVPRAIGYFLRQDYPNRELIVIDDGADPVHDLVPDDPRIRYIRLETRTTVGAKRNLGCQLACGTVIAHWDDDDWIAERRLSCQVQTLLAQPETAVCGLRELLFLDENASRAWLYSYPPHELPWLAGGTLCYRKPLNERYPFQEINEGEDTRFVWSLPPGNLVAQEDYSFYVATIHSRNTSRKETQDPRWRPLPVEEIRRLMQFDFELYCSSD